MPLLYLPCLMYKVLVTYNYVYSLCACTPADAYYLYSWPSNKKCVTMCLRVWFANSKISRDCYFGVSVSVTERGCGGTCLRWLRVLAG